MSQAKITKANLELFKAVLSFAQQKTPEVEEIKDGLQEYHDEKSEKWQEGDNAADHLEVVSKVEAVFDALNSLSDALEEIDGIND